MVSYQESPEYGEGDLDLDRDGGAPGDPAQREHDVQDHARVRQDWKEEEVAGLPDVTQANSWASCFSLPISHVCFFLIKRNSNFRKCSSLLFNGVATLSD